MPQSTADPQVEIIDFSGSLCAFEFGIVSQNINHPDDDDDESHILNFECSVRLRKTIVRAEHKLIPEKFKPWPCFNMS